MNKEFVPYEEALTLKKLHFNEPCLGWYDEGGNFYTEMQEYLPAPLYQQAFRWFREKHKLSPIVSQFGYGIEDEYGKIIHTIPDEENPLSYEEAELACLRKLTEIVNQNKDE